MTKLLMVVLTSSVIMARLYAQAPGSLAPGFEVASIRPSKSASENTHFGIQGDRFTADNTTVKELITLIYTALREQLGLKLEATRGPVDVLVIDYVERPIVE